MAVSSLRLSGMASGLDTDNIIKQLMASERAPLNRLVQKKQILEWQQANYRELNSKTFDLRTQIFNMKLQSTYKQYSTASSNESIVSATATSVSGPTSFTFNEITSLAKAANIATGAGQNISRSTSVVTGGSIAAPIDTNVNNTFKINFNGAGFVDITLDPGKVYDGVRTGGRLEDLASDIQAKLDAALGAGQVKATLTQNNNIQFTANDFPGVGAPKSIILQEGAANDLLKTSLGFNTDSTTKQISATIQKMDLDQSIYFNLQQHRFKNTEDFGWVVNGSDSQTLGAPADNIISTVAFNGTNVGNYKVSATESQSITVAAASNTFTTTINYKGASIAELGITVNGTRYKAVTGKTVPDLGANEVLVSDDGTGKFKLMFKNQLAINDRLEISSKKSYSVVTGKVQADLTDGEVLLEDDGTGKAKFTFKSQISTGTKVEVDRHDFEFNTTINNQDGTTSTATFNVNAMKDTMNTLMAKIGANSTAGLTAFYDSGTDKMILNAKKTGDNNTSGADIILGGNFMTNALKMNDYKEGGDAAFTVNGLATTRKDNTFVLNGVTFNLKGTTTVANPVNVTVAQDTTKVFESIKAFVDKYNETINTINTKLTEKKYMEFKPLTPEQKENMSEKEAERWEEKAKSGLLNADSILTSFTSSMRNSLYNKVENTTDSNYSQLAQIGITTSVVYQERGKLVIDEAKLKDAIAKAPEKVMELFTKVSTSTDSAQKYKENGLAVRLYDDATNAISKLSAKAGSDGAFTLYDNSVIGKEITRVNTDVANMEDRLTTKENNYYKRFAALETAMSKMNSQSSWLSQQVGAK